MDVEIKLLLMWVFCGLGGFKAQWSINETMGPPKTE